MAALTYSEALSEDRDKVRFHLQDTVSGSGPKPSDGNFSDAEIDGLVTLEGHWQGAVAAGFETLAAAWRRYPNYSADGVKLDRSDIAAGYAEQAAIWRAQYGRAGDNSIASLERTDAYSDDGSEYA